MAYMSRFVAEHATLSITGFLLLFGVFWGILYCRFKGSYYFMDPQDSVQSSGEPQSRRLRERTFLPLMERYFDIAKTVIGLDAGSIAVLAGFLWYVASNRTDFSNVQEAIRVPVFLFCFSIFFLVWFLVHLSMSYENYLVNPKSYGAWKYALTTALGIFGVVCLGFGYLFLLTGLISLRLNPN